LEVRPIMKKISSMKSFATVSIILALVMVLSAARLCSVRAQNQLSVSIQVSNDSGYTIVTGTVKDASQNPVEGAAVSVQAVDSSGKTVHMELVYTDQNGAFTDKFKAPEGITGEGNIFVSASKPGYENGLAQTAFTAVPEFPTALGAIIASIFAAFLILRRRKG
jgi:hypothetical protein